MNTVLDAAVLVLNRLYQPVRVTSARTGFVLLVRGVAQAVDDSGDVFDFCGWAGTAARDGEDLVHTVSMALRVPRVVRLVRYDRLPGAALHLSHRNVMVRDRYQCQYCGATPGADQLNIDHVLPRCRGGRDSWENLVTSCRPCNLRKGRHTPEECNMRLSRQPSPPRWSALYQVLLRTGPTCKAWEPFLQAG